MSIDTPTATPSEAAPRLLRVDEQALARTSGAPLLAGNAVRILRDATDNFPAWLAAIRAAKQRILFENYLFAKDEVGREFVAALALKASEGVRVRLIYDWLGTPFPGRLFRPLVEAGGEVRRFNPPRLDNPLGWMSRDHRKSIVVDGQVGFVSGLCVSRRWMGDPAHGIEPWRDTGAELRGPAVAEIEQAFARVWREMGASIPDEELATVDAIPPAGDVEVTVVATEPAAAGMYRLDQFIATIARRTLWLTDAYFVGMPAYVQALRAAAADGVDVRLLVPGASDLLVVSAFSRAGYRPLLEAGVRLFEWNGTMLHAKTAVADCRWSRVGSSNLNASSFLANYELDIAIYDEGIAREMEELYLSDLERATEIVLNQRRRVRPLGTGGGRGPERGRMRASASRAAASAMRIGNTVGAALTNRRVLGPSEAGLMAKSGAALLVLAALAVIWPEAVAVPVGIVAGWVGVALMLKAWKLRQERRRDAGADLWRDEQDVGVSPPDERGRAEIED